MERIIRRIVHTRGDSSYVKDLETFFHSMGNRTRIISKEDKIKYHAAAAISSNYMTALFSMSEQLLLDCGFAQEEARSELYALAKGNLDHILTQGCVQSLTGPLERNDCATVEKHISALNENSGKYILPVLNISQISHRASIRIVITRR